MTLEWIRFSLAAIFIATGLLIMLSATFGVYRFKYVLNRMHSAAMGDTLGILSLFLGLMMVAGFSFDTLKMILIVLFFWMAGPVSSHLITRLETTVNEHLRDECDVAEIKGGEDEEE